MLADITVHARARWRETDFSAKALAALNEMITGQVAFVGDICQCKVMMIAMLIVSPLVPLLKNLTENSESIISASFLARHR